ncbi:hypothetical protein B5M09_000214 [Aphanomyces astaci]|uniref:EF-hand domain-containing protein n=1 Tax=Aphanomyces astaci TaxID=112090 RepID=A0A3R7X253_APHAT|nr:hypothetical protein B5M09_000214 [Aphanomyces astaci]
MQRRPSSKQQHPLDGGRSHWDPSTPLLDPTTASHHPPYHSVVVDVDKVRAPSGGSINACPAGGDERWTHSTNPLPTFTVEDAKSMEWDYAHVVVRSSSHSSMSGSCGGGGSEFEQLDVEDNEELGVLLDPFYDVTTGRLRRMFRHFAPHGEEKVSYDAFHKGLLALGISPPPDIPFDVFVQKIDFDHDGMVSLDEFIHVVQMIKQAHLFKPEHVAQEDKFPTSKNNMITTSFSSSSDFCFPLPPSSPVIVLPSPLSVPASPMILRVVDYSPTSIHTVAPVTKLQSFMFSSKPHWAKVRWVHVAGFKRVDDVNLRRLAIKYQLHPLALEDCLNHDDMVRCKYEHYEDHAFLCVPVIRPLDGLKKKDMETYINRHRYDLYAKDQGRAMLSRQLRNQSYWNTTVRRGSLGGFGDEHLAPQRPTKVVDKASKKRQLEETLDNLKLLMRKPQQLCIFIHKHGNVISVQEESDVDTVAGFQLWQSVFNNQMGKSYSKIRNHDAHFLVMSMLNAVADEMRPLVHVMEVQLTTLGKLLRVERTKFNPKRLTKTKKSLLAIDKIVKPLVDLVEGQLMDQDEFNKGEVRNYLRDVRDHLKQMAVSLKESLQTLAELVEEDKQIRAKHKDDVLYIMSICATLFLPGTFMTGLYGMNFDNMPELHTEYGYFVWWAVFLMIVTTLFTFLRFVKQWI